MIIAHYTTDLGCLVIDLSDLLYPASIDDTLAIFVYQLTLNDGFDLKDTANLTQALEKERMRFVLNFVMSSLVEFDFVKARFASPMISNKIQQFFCTEIYS